MIYRTVPVLLALSLVGLFAAPSTADAPKEVKTEKNKTVVLGNLLSAPNNCGTNPGPVPVPKLREKPSHGAVGLQIVTAEIAAINACPARKMLSIALFYTPEKDFVGKDSVQVEFETTDNKIPGLSFSIIVQAPSDK